MPVRTAEAEWKGNLSQGSGRMKTQTGSYEGAYSFASSNREPNEYAPS